MAAHCSESQIAQILEHLEDGKEITPIDALNKYGCFRLGAVIYKLKREGYLISSRLQHYKKPSGRNGHYAVYKLIQKENKIV